VPASESSGADAIASNGDMAMGAGEVGIHSGSLPRPGQRLPANQRLRERKERLADARPDCHSARTDGETDSALRQERQRTTNLLFPSGPRVKLGICVSA